MANADTPLPSFKTYAEGKPIPPVDPEDIKRLWHLKPPWSWQDQQAACSPGADIGVVSRRKCIIETLIIYKLLGPWQLGEELHEAVFRIAATFPLHEVKHKPYMIPGDEHFGFDPNAFVQRLIEETGISHVWEPVATRVPERGRCYVTMDVSFEDQVRSPEREAKRQTRDLVWNIWKRFSPSLDQLLAHSDKEQAAHIVATFFADFLMDNMDLVRQLEAAFKEPQSIPLDPILSELERRAQGRI